MPVVPSEVQRIERVLATARIFLAVTTLVATWLDPTQPTRSPAMTYVALIAYAIHSLLILVLLRIRHESTPAFRFTVHAVDVVWPAFIAVYLGGNNTSFFVFNMFVLLAAAYRWGFEETIATAGAAVVLYSGEVFFDMTESGLHLALGKEVELNRFIMRGLYSLIMGYLLGFLGEEQKQLRGETSGTARIVSKAQAQIGLRGALRAVLDEVLRLFSSHHALLVLREESTGRVFFWEARREAESQDVMLSPSELDPAQRKKFLIDPPGQAWHALRRRWPKGPLDLVVMDYTGMRIQNVAWTPPEAFLQPYEFRSLLAVSLTYGNEWSGHMFILDPSLGTSREAAVHFLRALSQQVTPAIYSVFLLRRLRSRAGAVERARVARELHDGIIQALIGLEMQVDVLRRQPNGTTENLVGELARIQELLHQEVLNLRELMQQMKPLDLGPKQVLDFLAYTVDRFGRDAGISARFITTFDEVQLPPRYCNELARIVQEALVNVRKHSGARNVMVRFGAEDGFWKLIIDDDGFGFDFSGRLPLAQLDAMRQGPAIIKERVRSIGGELTVESRPGRGARLEISVPQRVHG